MAKRRGIIAESFSVAVDLGVRMATPIVLCAYLANYLSERYGMGTGWGLLIILFGVLSGIWNVYKLLYKLAAKTPIRGRSKEKGPVERE
ncbi:MAG: synthase protein [Bacillota bacterium]|nr:synthase protein [Bacillota bacterium]